MNLTIRQASERLQVSTRTIARRIAAGNLPVIKDGARIIRIDEADLLEYIEQRRTNAHKSEETTMEGTA